jgi:pimeloyl-ACP methyl ester carboxylesterase
MRNRSDHAAAETLRAFLDACGRAAGAGCAFSAGSAGATRAKYFGLLRRLRTHPESSSISYPKLTTMTLGGLYEVADWKKTATMLQKVWASHNKQKLALAAPGPSLPDRLFDPSGRAAAATKRYDGPEQLFSIVCSDSPNPGPGAYGALDRFAARRSGAIGRVWAWGGAQCANWPARAADRFTGPFNRRTLNPVLVINTRFDPATPYQNAVAVSRLLPRARLLTVDGFGHVALLNPSACANGHLSSYLIGLQLPPPGTRCEQDEKPFG